MKTTVNFDIAVRGIEFERDEIRGIEFEFSIIPELLNDVESAVYAIAEEVVKLVDIYMTEKKMSYPTKIYVETEVFGMRFKAARELTQQVHDELKPKQKPLNPESVQNDIRYIDNMLVSEAPVLDVRKWIYHILNKHFDVEIPEALKNEVTDATVV